MLARQHCASLIDTHCESKNIARRTRRAARVEGQPLEERIVALQRDMEQVAHRRASSTMDQRSVELCTNQASHTARWASSEDQRATFINLPKGGPRLTTKMKDFDTKWDEWTYVVPIATHCIGLKNATHHHPAHTQISQPIAPVAKLVFHL